jgi:hypothetical protein
MKSILCSFLNLGNFTITSLLVNWLVGWLLLMLLRFLDALHLSFCSPVMWNCSDQVLTLVGETGLCPSRVCIAPVIWLSYKLDENREKHDP